MLSFWHTICSINSLFIKSTPPAFPLSYVRTRRDKGEGRGGINIALYLFVAIIYKKLMNAEFISLQQTLRRMECIRVYFMSFF